MSILLRMAFHTKNLQIFLTIIALISIFVVSMKKILVRRKIDVADFASIPPVSSCLS